MQFKIFQISISGDSESEEDMNKFLRSYRIVTVQRELVHTSSGTYWCFCVEYLDQALKSSTPSNFTSKKAERVDYKEILSESDFAAFSRMRDLRKVLAQTEAVPVYTVCTNEHLAQMVQNRCTSLSSLQQIPGFGEAKVEKYGRPLLELLEILFKDGET